MEWWCDCDIIHAIVFYQLYIEIACSFDRPPGWIRHYVGMRLAICWAKVLEMLVTFMLSFCFTSFWGYSCITWTLWSIDHWKDLTFMRSVKGHGQISLGLKTQRKTHVVSWKPSTLQLICFTNRLGHHKLIK